MIREHVKINISIIDLSRLSAYYTQARYPNAGIERPSKEIMRKQPKKPLNIGRSIINKISKAIKDP